MSKEDVELPTDETDDYVIEDDLTDEEIAFLLKCVEEREKGLVEYVDLDDVEW